MNLDHQIKTSDRSWTTPDYVTLGAFAEVGSDKKTLVHDADGNPTGATTNSEISAVGAHVALDWKMIGVDVGAMGLKLPDDSGTFLMPRLGLRLGIPQFYVSATVLSGSPIISDGNTVNAGVGTQLGSAQFWAGLGGIAQEGSQGVGIFRAGYNFKPVVLHFTLQGDIQSNHAHSENYGVSAGLEFRLPK